MLVRVRLSTWEVEECGWIIRIGDRVSWILVFQQSGDRWRLPELEVHQLEGQASSIAGFDWHGAGLYPTRLAVGTVSLYWDAPKRIQGPIGVAGTIHRGDATGETPEDFPDTQGVVRRIWLISSKPHEGQPGPCIVHEEVTESRIISSGTYTTADGKSLIWSGVLVELDVKG